MNRGQLINTLDDLLAEVALIDTATPGDPNKAKAVGLIREIKADLMTKRPRGKNDETETEAETEEATEEI